MLFKIIKQANQIYLLKDRADCYSTLVLGEERALVWDTGCGIDNLKETIRTITNLPLLVILSHGHFDHIGGSSEFEEAYMSEKDFVILESYDEKRLNQWIREMIPEAGDRNASYAAKSWLHIKRLDFEEFNLGNLPCQIVSLPGHSEGSVGVLIPKLRLLLSGDALTPIMCLIFTNHGTKETQLKTLESLKTLEFDYFLTSHSEKMFSRKWVPRMIDCIIRSSGKKHYEYNYTRPPYSKGMFYLDSMEEEPVGLVVDKEDL